jgi:hypothetical protein
VKIEVGITHEVVINGDKSWVRLSITDDVPEGIDPDIHLAFVSKKVNEKLIEVIEQTVETVNNYSKEQ